VTFYHGFEIGIYEDGSVLNYLYFSIIRISVPFILFWIGAMTDFSALISNPKLMLLSTATQVDILLVLIQLISFNPF